MPALAALGARSAFRAIAAWAAAEPVSRAAVTASGMPWSLRAISDTYSPVVVETVGRGELRRLGDEPAMVLGSLALDRRLDLGDILVFGLGQRRCFGPDPHGLAGRLGSVRESVAGGGRGLRGGRARGEHHARGKDERGEGDQQAAKVVRESGTSVRGAGRPTPGSRPLAP